MTLSTPKPHPIRVDVIDLDSSDTALAHSSLKPANGFEKAWVVARRSGVPRGIVEVDLTEAELPVADQLRAGFALELVSTLQQTRPVADALLPRISVVIPSIFARREELERCLASMDRLDYPDFEIILVDNRRSTPAEDFAGDLLRGRRVHLLQETTPGISAARNAGLAEATGDVVVFTDDDVQVDPRWLRAIGERFVQQPDLHAVTGLILPSQLDTPAQIWFEHYYGGFSGRRTFERLTLTAGPSRRRRMRVTVRREDGQELRTFAVYGVGAYGAGANMAFRRQALTDVGGFDLALGTGTPARGGEDLAVLIDVLWSGGTIGYEPAAVVFHQHRQDYRGLVAQLNGNGTGFTAMLTSLVHRDPAHLWGLVSQLPKAVKEIAAQSLGRVRGLEAGGSTAGPAVPRSYPPHLVLHELWGMVKGPAAYLRSEAALRPPRSPREAELPDAGAAGPLPRSLAGDFSDLVQRSLEDVDAAARHLWLNTLGGSPFVPRAARRLLYSLAGARMESAPGLGGTIVGDPHFLTVKGDVYLNRGVFIEAHAPVIIGEGCAIGMQAMILTSHHALSESGLWNEEADGRSVSIGERVWIGARAVILPGATVEPDVVIAAGAVVVGTCRSHGLYAGVPARRVKDLSPSES